MKSPVNLENWSCPVKNHHFVCIFTQLELKENCLSIVQRNTDLKKRLEERKRLVK